MPLYLFNRFERFGSQLLTVHANEPLFGGAEDGRPVTAPAMRIAVLHFLLLQQFAILFKDFDDQRVCIPNRFAENFFR
jgi:hypothetical protein